ncbi:MAG: hypothetical protein ACRDHF_13885, partial [Tepidiformaceae bacterium]
MKRAVRIVLTVIFLAACTEVPEATSPVPPPQFKPGKKLTITMTDLGTLGGASSEALDINQSGAIVGSAQHSSGLVLGFLWQNSVFTALELLLDAASGRAEFINNTGMLAGRNTVAGQFRAVVWPIGGGTPIDITPLGWSSSRPTAQSENGLVVGWGLSLGEGIRSFIRDGNESAQLPDLGGDVQAFG